MQEDKEAVFDAADTVKMSLAVFCGMFESLSFNRESMYKGALGGYMNATDAADWMVKKGVPFREAHEITGKLVLYAIDKKLPLEGLTLDELKAVSPVLTNHFTKRCRSKPVLIRGFCRAVPLNAPC
jgi:argininosuccinate lyase